MSAEYTVPRIHSSNKFLGNKVLTNVLADWGTGWYLQYQSGALLALPASAGTDPISNILGRGPGPAQLVAGQSLWSTNWTDYAGVVHTTPININCGCFDPTKTQVLNPAGGLGQTCQIRTVGRQPDHFFGRLQGLSSSN